MLQKPKLLKHKVWKYGLHVLGWILFLTLPYLLSFKKAVQFDELWTNPRNMKNLLSWILLIGFSYFNHLWLVPSFYLDRKYVPYILLVLLSFAAIIWLPEMIDLFPFQPTMADIALSEPPLTDGNTPGASSPPMSVPPKPEFAMEISHFVLLFILSVIISIAYHTQLRLQLTEQQRLETELAHLKAQIQPHFLFNTLNSIYALAIRQDEKTADTVVQLSEFLRYVIRDARGNRIAVDKELAYLRNYVDLQKSRLRDSVEVDFEVSGNTAGQEIVPLILFSFVENAFKHGVSPDEDSRILIRIEALGNGIRLYVFNKKVTVVSKEANSGIGVENARKRLKLLYPNLHTLQVTETSEDYTVELFISTDK